MCTNISIKETVEIINNRFKNNNFTSWYIKQITSILNYILIQNYFTYNNIYQQKDGLKMRAPASAIAIISIIFLQHLDSEIHNNIKNLGPLGLIIDM